MIVVTCEVREVDATGSHLLLATTDVPDHDEAISSTLLRVAALAGTQLERRET